MCPRKGGKQILEDFVIISDQQVATLVQEAICQAPPTWLNHAEEHFLNNLDFLKPIRVKTNAAMMKVSETQANTLYLASNQVSGDCVSSRVSLQVHLAPSSACGSD